MSAARQTAALAIHCVAATVALALTLYFLFSDALSFEFPDARLAQRPRIVVSACFGAAAFLLFTGATRYDGQGRVTLGYGLILLGIAVVWLIFEGAALV